MDFSPEQKVIIGEPVNNILVSASAGSGKTTVLTARIGDEVKTGKLSVDSMLVVTFTEDAAAHMSDKIEQKLRDLRAEAVESGDTELAALLSSQIDLLPNAYIQTMHGFCSRVIKEKGFILEDGPMAEFTDPSCRIITGSERDVLLRSAAEHAIRDIYKRCQSEDDAFIRFTRRFGDGRDDSSLVSAVTRVYLTLRSLPDYNDVCDRFVKEREERDANGQIMYFEGDNDISKAVVDYLQKIKEVFESGEIDEVCTAHDFRITEDYTNEEYFSEVISRINAVIDSYGTRKGIDFFGSLGPLKELGKIKYKSMFKDPDLKGDDQAILALVSLRRFMTPGTMGDGKYDNKYDLPSDYIDFIELDKTGLLEKQKAGTEAVRCFVELLKTTDRFYAELKNSMHGMDFSDLEHTAYEILKTEEASAFYGEKFKEIFVDEYQDNTRLQDKIIERFESAEGNVFRVGDIKQSIYKFRYADPKIFGNRMDEIIAGKQKGVVRFLKENHRSTCEILAFANYVFEQTMSREGSEIEYDEGQKLSKAKETRHGDLPRIVVANDDFDIPDDGDKTKAENRALFAAVESEVRRYMETCTRLDGKKPELKDICVLTASNNQAQSIAKYLNGCVLSDGRKLEAAGRFSSNVFEDMDIHRLINFLICLGNEYRDEYLAGVMFSNYQFSNFTVEDLARIQVFIHELDGPSLDKEPLMLRLRIFGEKCDSELAGRVKEFIRVFDKIRMRAMVVDIDDIIELIYRETCIKATIEARTGDSSKFDIFKDWLSANFKRRGSDISGIAEDLEQMKIQIKKAEIEVEDANKDKITTMTVHKSKGLEFKFVILVATGWSDEQKDKLSDIVFDRDDGFIINDYDPEAVTRVHSSEQMLYKTKMNLAVNAETLRLLYVALTRAEENLSVVTVSSADSSKSGPLRDAFLQAVGYEEKVFDKRHWLSGNMKIPYCLMSALARSADGETLRKIADCGELRPDNVIPFLDLDGNAAKGFEVVDLTAARVLEIYGEHGKLKKSPEEKKGEGSTEKAPEFDEDGKLVFADYAYQDSVDIPFKVAVTGVAGEGEPFETTHVDMQIRGIDDFESANVSMLTAAARGTVLHRIMRFIDLAGLRNGTVTFDDEIKALIDGGFLNICSAEDALKVASEFKNGILAFCQSDICTDIISSFENGTARSEKPIVFSVFVEGDSGDSVLVQGIIDLIFKTENGYVILDYKTDRLKGESAEARAKEALSRHAFQLESYAAACEEDGITVARRLLYLVRYGEFVEV